MEPGRNRHPSDLAIRLNARRVEHSPSFLLETQGGIVTPCVSPSSFILLRLVNSWLHFARGLEARLGENEAADHHMVVSQVHALLASILELESLGVDKEAIHAAEWTLLLHQYCQESLPSVDGVLR